MSLTALQKSIHANFRAGMENSGSTAAVIVRKGSTDHAVSGCLVKASDNQRAVEEWGADHARTIKVSVPKTTATGAATLPSAPDADLDLLIYNGITYTIRRVMGHDDPHPFWTVEGASPIGS